MLLSRVEKFFREKAHIFGVQVAFVYGSQARGLPRQDSDLDIAVIFKNEALCDEITFDLLSDISLSLSEETDKNVDVIPIYRDFQKPMLYYNAIVQGTPVYIDDYEAFLSLRNEAIAQMEDFSIFGTQWQVSLAREKLRDLSHA